jgi:flagellar hook-associated protein 1 FlgK
MSNLLSIGASGVLAYQTALTTVSENIANVDTDGYSRRTTTLNEIPAGNGTIDSLTRSPGSGVLVGGIASSSDPQLNAAVRDSGADLAKTESSVTWLNEVESALSGNDLGARLTSFFTDANAVAADPTAAAPRATMLEDADAAASAFTATGQALDQADTDLDTTANASVSTLTGLATALAKINDGLGRTQPGSAAAAQLGDQRDQLLEQMSAISDVSVTMDSAGRATVKVGGAAGTTLVDGNNAGQLSYSRNDDGAVSLTVSYQGQVSTFAPNGGALAGVVDGANQIAGARASLNQIASSFTAGVNAVQAQGSGLSGAAGAPMFTTGDSPTDITMTLKDPNGIAAAAPGGGTRDNSNLQALAALRTSGNFEGALTDLQSTNAAVLTQRQTVADAQTSIHDGAVSQRASTSGVNLDSEAVDLMRFQQAYSASSRVVQTAQDCFQSIIQIQ